MPNTADAITFTLGKETFSIWRLPPRHPVDWAKLTEASWYSVTSTAYEISIVVPATVDLGRGARQDGWSRLNIEGPLAFDLIGIIAGVAEILAEAKISIFSVSTYDTDYFFVRTGDVDSAVSALEAAGHLVKC